MGANRTGSQLRASQGCNCFGSPCSEPFSQPAASLQTVILHRWGIKCWFRNVGFISEFSSLQNYKPSSKMWRAGLWARKCKLLQLALKSQAISSAWFRQVDMPCLPTNHLPYWGTVSSFSIFCKQDSVAQTVINPSPGSGRGASKAVLHFYTYMSYRRSGWL